MAGASHVQQSVRLIASQSAARSSHMAMLGVHEMIPVWDYTLEQQAITFHFVRVGNVGSLYLSNGDGKPATIAHTPPCTYDGPEEDIVECHRIQHNLIPRMWEYYLVKNISGVWDLRGRCAVASEES